MSSIDAVRALLETAASGQPVNLTAEDKRHLRTIVNRRRNTRVQLSPYLKSLLRLGDKL